MALLARADIGFRITVYQRNEPGWIVNTDRRLV